jgi:hypothetical protein
MIAFAISALVGASLGLRFKVFVLGPVMTIAAVAAIAIGLLTPGIPASQRLACRGNSILGNRLYRWVFSPDLLGKAKAAPGAV